MAGSSPAMTHQEIYHARRLYFRSRANAARQGQEGRLAARGDAHPARNTDAGSDPRPQQGPRYARGRRCDPGLRRPRWRAGREHCPRGCSDGWLRRERARRSDQPLLRLRPRSGEHGGGKGDVRPVAHGDRRRRRIHEPRADGIRWRRVARRSRRGDADLFRAAGHQRGPHRNQIRHQPRRRGRLRRREPQARGQSLGRRPLRQFAWCR